MNELQKQLLLRSKELEEAIEYAESILKSAPAGHLRISKRREIEQYYVRDIAEHGYGTYIKKKNTELIHALAQKDYAQRLLTHALQEKDKIKRMIDMYVPKNMKEVYEELSPQRQKIVNPYILTDDMFIEQWQSELYERKEVKCNQDCEIITERGEVVRSKSEKILADKFKLMNIPYHYEKPLYLKEYGIVYPDFLTLNRRTRKEYYWEHFGLMDNPDYCEKAVCKIESMQKNGIYLGENLIVTFETQVHPLNMRIVEDLIKKYLL